jgi:ATP-dependent Clp protease ATP-binding subunit ClpC
MRIEALSGKRTPIPVSHDLPLSSESKRVLAFAGEEADELGSKHIGTEHIFLGLLRTEDGMAANLLDEHGVNASADHEELGTPTPATPVQAPTAAAPTNGMFKDLTQAAMDGLLDPIVGRDLEMDTVIEILCGSARRNPILVGKLGAGKSAIVQGLAQRIAAGQVPSDLANQRVVEVDPELLASWTTDRQSFDEFIKLMGTISDPGHSILFIDCFLRLSASQTSARSQDFSGFLQWTLSQAGMRCIAVAEDREFPIAVQSSPWLVQEFREMHVRPLSEEATLLALQNRRTKLEKFHGVIYDDAALEAAMRAATRDMSGATLPRTALELLDVAGTMIKLRRGKPPAEIEEAQKRIASISELKNNALQDRDFDKARALGEAERKEQENLRALQKKRAAKSSAPDTVTPEDIKKVIARWSAYPYSQ